MDTSNSTFDLTKLNLSARFALLMGIVAVTTLALFFFFARYTLDQSERELERRGQLLTETVGQQSVLPLVMGDSAGLGETLRGMVDNGSALAGAFYDADDVRLVENSLFETLGREARDVMKGGETLQWTTTEAGTPALIAVSDIEREGEVIGSLLTVLPAETVEAQKQTSYLIAGGIFAGVLLLALFVMWQLRRTVARPIRRLNDAASQVEDGDLSTRVEIDQQDEVGELATSFNAMVAASEAKTEAMKEQSAEAEEARQRSEVLQREAEEEQTYLKKQFERISGVLAAVVDGDLTRRLDVETDDAVGELMQQVNKTIDELSSLIREVESASNQLSSAAQLAASSAEEMSAGATGQAKQTTEVAAAIEEMSATVEDSSKHADRSNEMAQRASELAANGEEVFEETAEGMERIAGLVNTSADKVTALGESSGEIGEIIQVIEDIADQTNLLALNAAIEAARAGEHGKGFAVVADEVRQLAERTTAATQKIADMITQIQEETDEVVASMERGTGEVENGLDLAEDASDALSEIVGSIDGMVTMIDQIAAASQQQATATNQIAGNVESISAVADEVSHSTDNLTQMAVDMTQQAEDLNGLIEGFTVNETAAASGKAAPPGDGAPAAPVEASGAPSNGLPGGRSLGEGNASSFGDGAPR